MSLPHPYAPFLAKLLKPTRYVGGEYNQVSKPPGSVKARVCLAFPDVYDIGMSHLGTKILYGVLNRHSDVACERVFAPWPDLEAALRERALPLVTLESADPLSAFDVIGFSLQYELTYTNVLNMLELGGVPIRASARGDAAPLVIAGGPTATQPEPLAPFIDAFFIGEAEEHLPALCLDAAELRRSGVPRKERLIQLASRYPLYVPELYDTESDAETGFVVVAAPIDARVPAHPRRVWVQNIDAIPFPDNSPVPHAESIFDRMAVEIARGCTEGCRFCQAGIIYRPVRERDPVAVLDSLVGGVEKGGYDETSLTCLSTADYSCVTPLVKEAMARLRPERVSLSVSSLRAYGLNDDLLAEMATMKAQGLTFAPEAGTQRMRDVITKNVTEADIVESAHRVFSRGFQRMKLYFMIGLPTETDEDVLGIIDTAATVQRIARQYLKSAEITASVSVHVPKPHTPFQWVAMDREAETARKQALLRSYAREKRIKLKMHDSPQAHLECLFARGDRRAAEILELAFRAGCRFDGWDEQLRMDAWDQAIDTVAAADPSFDLGRYFDTVPVTARLPWDHLDIAVDPDFLKQEYRKALKDRLSPPCGKPYNQLLHPNSVAQAESEKDRKLVCYDCGVACDLTAMKEERLVFLRRMNAWTPPVAAAPVQRPEKKDLNKVSRHSRPTTSAAHVGPVFRYRVRFSKTGSAAYLGQLDLNRHVPRIFRRAGIEAAYGGGFRPRPLMAFGPALALGIPSAAEVFDVSIMDKLEPEELVRRLQAVTLPGLRFIDASPVAEGAPSLGQVLREAVYVARHKDPAVVRAAHEGFRSGQPLSLVRRGEGGSSLIGKRIDLRETVTRIQVVDGAEADRACESLDWAPAPVPMLRFAVELLCTGHARPGEVLDALCGLETAAEFELGRAGLFGRELSP